MALLKEISLQKNYLQGEMIETIYLGGGTPSLLEKDELLKISRELQQHFDIQAGVEFTLEANPDDINAKALRDWKDAGINRLSIGIQSFFEEDLQWMNRAHNALQAKNCIVLAQEAGFLNLSADFIYGGPTLTDDKWEKNIATALSLGIPHLSCYALTVEAGTALQKMIVLHKKEDVDTEKQARHFLLLMDWLKTAGFEHYEISNFAKPGFRSRHNSSYWGRKKYLGLGPSAHSYNQRSRQWNVANNALYVQSLIQDKIPFEEESLTPVQHLNEYIMTSLRTMEGLDLDLIENSFGKNTGTLLREAAGKFIKTGRLSFNKRFFQLTKEGKLFADGIAADLFFNGSYDGVNNLLPEPRPGEAPLK